MKIIRTPLNGEDAVLLDEITGVLSFVCQHVKDSYSDWETITIIDGNKTYNVRGNLVNVTGVGVEDADMPRPRIHIIHSRQYSWEYRAPEPSKLIVRSHKFKSADSTKNNLIAVRRAILKRGGKVIDRGFEKYVKSSNGTVIMSINAKHYEELRTYFENTEPDTRRIAINDRGEVKYVVPRPR